MPFVVLHVISNVSFAVIARYARGDPLGYFRVGAINYAFAMIVAFVAALLTGGLSFEWPATLFALYQGAQYQLLYVVIFVMLAAGGLAVTFTILRLSVILPILGSIVFWGDPLPVVRAVGIAISLIALPLVGADARRVGRQMGLRRPTLLMLLAMLMSGSGALAAKAFAETRVEAGPADFSAAVFLAATALSLATWPLALRLARSGGGPGSAGSIPALRWWRRSLFVGAGLGVANVVQNAALVQALTVLPGSMVFPVVSSGYVVLITLADLMIWKHRFGKLSTAGMILAVAGLVFVNL